MVTIAEDKVGEKPKTSPIVVVRGQKAAIAAQLEFDDDALLTRIKQFRKEQPKLFCDFPLIGSHDFPFPVVINSPSFNPNEPRSTVWLTDVDDPRVKENEEIIKEALGLYKELLSYASSKGWVDLFNLINFSPTIESEWLSADWFNENVVHPLHQYILYTKLVDNPTVGRISMQSENGFSLVNFPSSVTPEIREKLWELAQVWVPATLPVREEIHDWYSVIWPDCATLSLDTIADFIQERQNLETLGGALNRDEKTTMRWLNYFYTAANLDTSFRHKK